MARYHNSNMYHVRFLTNTCYIVELRIDYVIDKTPERVSANADPTIRNYTVELPTFGVIAEVNLAVVQWQGLARGERSA